jgi:branched-chain amino acid transport system ATP-binding protein
MNTVLKLDGISAGYGSIIVVRDISLKVDSGQVVALIGPNGAGKTTTLCTASGQLSASRGSVELFGQRTTAPMARRVRDGLAIVTDDRSVFHTLTVRDNLRLGRGSVADAIATFPELESHLGRRTGLLSGGQQQMLGVGRALAARPKLLLADEISLGLAPIIVRRLMQTLRTAAAEQGTGVLLVEQSARLALEVADYAYVLSHGRVVAEGSGQELRADIGKLEAAYLGGLTRTTS